VTVVLTKRGSAKDEADAVDPVGVIVSELAMQRSLKDVGVGNEKLDALADNC